MITGILLAAGAGTRFGGNKQLAPVPDGRTMLDAAAATLRAAVDDLIIVIRDEAALYTHAADIARALSCSVVVNTNANQGMASSIVCGVRHSMDAAGWLLALADMPFIKPQTIHTVADVLRANVNQAMIVQPVYKTARGHPVGFTQYDRAALLALQGDTGARTIIAAASMRLIEIDVDDSGVVRDVDTPQALGHNTSR